MANKTFRIATAVCRIVLACTFIVSGFLKVIDPWGTSLKVNEYLSIYGVEFLRAGSMPFSIWLCGAELMMGCGSGWCRSSRWCRSHFSRC